MLRRNFLKFIGALPFVGLVKLSVAKPKVADEGLMVEDVSKIKAKMDANPLYLLYFDSNANITSIEYPDGYKNNSNCVILIREIIFQHNCSKLWKLII